MKGKVKTKVLDHSTTVKNGVLRVGFGTIAIVVEIAWLVAVFLGLNQYYFWVEAATKAFSIVLVLALYSMNKNAAIKLTWILLILISPIFGIVLYLLVGLSGTTKRMKQRFARTKEELLPDLLNYNTLFKESSMDEIQGDSPYDELRFQDKRLSNISRYIFSQSDFPIYRAKDLKYYPTSSEALQALKEDLKRAEKFIFMEYHAIDNKSQWSEIQDILAQKAKAGVEVRVVYDDMGSFGFINTDFVQRLAYLGIQCYVFNPMIPFINMFLNNRDHRKITVIDGKVAFSGGYNLVDYYFTNTRKYGEWKDSGIRFTGEAVNSMTYIFLEMWNSIRRNQNRDESVHQYFIHHPEVPWDKGTGYIQPYDDSPLSPEPLAENVYLSIIEQAEDYIYITTPYLIITEEMNRTLSRAAKRGIDVRIITPGKPDKKAVYRVTRSYYANLVKNGVRIYEYTPGFCHAKQWVSDDKIGVCGTINLDYRSLYHHFENACVIYECDAVLDIKRDFEKDFKLCNEITEEYAQERSVVMRILDMILRLFAPLL